METGYRQPDEATFNFIKENFKREDGSAPEWVGDDGRVLEKSFLRVELSSFSRSSIARIST